MSVGLIKNTLSPAELKYGKKSFEDLKISNYSGFVGMESHGDNTTSALIKARLEYGKFYMEECFSSLNEACENLVAKDKEINLQKLVVKASKSRMKNKEDVLSA